MTTPQQGQTPITDADERAIASMTGVRGVYRNPTSWYHNASFLLPLVATILVGLAGLVLRQSELLGFAGFLGFVTLAMLPVVRFTWQRTPTVVALTGEGITSLHCGRVLTRLEWSSVAAIRLRETQGNVRWEIATADGDRMLLDGELENLEGLIRTARELSGLGERSLD